MSNSNRSRALFDIAIPLVLGAIAATTILPISFLSLLLWIAVLLTLFRENRPQAAWGHAAVQSLVMAGVLFAAAIAPVKHIDSLLSTPVRLERSEYTLRELNELGKGQSDQQDSQPWKRVFFDFPESESDRVVRFPDSQLTLADFLETVESQAGMSYQTRGCGNTWTLARGTDICFWINILPPEEDGSGAYTW